MTVKTFKRYEKKFLMNEKQYTELLMRIAPYTFPDKNSRDGACYSISNIYFDTENNDIIRHSISHPYYKEKLRLRCYGVPVSMDDTVFLEFKKKIGGVVSKRRATLPLQSAYEFIKTGVKPMIDGYVNNIVVDEIMEFLRKNQVEPKVYIYYDRKAFFGKTDKTLRITVDMNIRSRRTDVALEKGDSGEPLLDSGTPYLMEIKFSKAMPLWLTEILSELKLYSTGFSKYGTEYRNYIMGKKNTVLPNPRAIPLKVQTTLTLVPTHRRIG